MMTVSPKKHRLKLWSPGVVGQRLGHSLDILLVSWVANTVYATLMRGLDRQHSKKFLYLDCYGSHSTDDLHGAYLERRARIFLGRTDRQMALALAASVEQCKRSQMRSTQTVDSTDAWGLWCTRRAHVQVAVLNAQSLLTFSAD